MRPLLALLALPLLLSAEDAPEPPAVPFAPIAEAGDVWTVRTRARFDLRLRVTELENGQEGATREKTGLSERVETRRVEITGGADGRPASWKVAFVESRVRESAEAPLAPDAAHGLALEIRGAEALPADAPDDVRARARRAEVFRALLPEGAKRPGESWEVKGSDLARFVVRGSDEEPAADSALKVELGDIREEKAGRIAALRVSGTLRVDSRQEFRIAYEVKGELLYNLDAQVPVSLALEGTAAEFAGAISDARGRAVGRLDGKGSRFEARVEYEVK
jgi:hypothetical protein